MANNQASSVEEHWYWDWLIISLLEYQNIGISLGLMGLLLSAK